MRVCHHHLSAATILMWCCHTPWGGKTPPLASEVRMQTNPTKQIIIIYCVWLFVLFAYIFGFIVINVILAFRTHTIIISYYPCACVIITYRLLPPSCVDDTHLGGVPPPIIAYYSCCLDTPASLPSPHFVCCRPTPWRGVPPHLQAKLECKQTPQH